MKEYCDGCRYLEFERRPKGEYAALCLNPQKPAWLGKYRTVDYQQTAQPVNIERPKWCGGGYEKA